MIGLDLLRMRVGLPVGDTSKDLELQGALDIALALMDRYTDRQLSHAATVEVFTHIVAQTIQLKAYPEVIISKISDDGIKYHLNDARGTLYVDGYAIKHELKIEYEGGYTVFPQDLLYALLLTFDSVWPAMSSSGGGAVAAGAVKSIKAGDISIQFDTGGSAGGPVVVDVIPPLAQGILNGYIRRQT